MMAKSAVGVYISGRAVQAARLEESGQEFRLTALVEIPAVGEEELARGLEEVAGIVEESDAVVVSAHYEETVIRHLHVPFKDRKQIARIIKFEVKPHLPFSLDDTAIDFYDCGSGEESGTEIIVAAARGEPVRRRLDLFKKAGVEVSAMELENIALFYACARTAAFTEKAGVLLLDIAAQRCLIGIARGEKLVFARAFYRKEEYLKESEITVLSFLEKNPNFVLEGAIVSGVVTDGELTEAEEALRTRFKVDTQRFKPGSDIVDEPGLLERSAGPARFVLPLGLALRGLKRRASGINLLGEAERRGARWRMLRRCLCPRALW